MANILFVQPIFAPDKKRLDRNIDSLRSIFFYFSTYKHAHNLKFMFGGWALSDENWKIIKDFIQVHFGQEPQRYEKNYGKAVVVNSLVSTSSKTFKHDFIFTMDSDIVFTLETPNIVDRLVSLSHRFSNHVKKPFGMFSLNQLGHNCHYHTINENIWEDGDETVLWPNVGSGIAGGCLFLSKELWEKTGGYMVFGVYAGDDAYMLLNCYKLGFSYAVPKNIGIIHPHENDEEYAKWKVMVCQRDSHTGVKKNINSQIHEAETFWKNRQ